MNKNKSALLIGSQSYTLNRFFSSQQNLKNLWQLKNVFKQFFLKKTIILKSYQA